MSRLCARSAVRPPRRAHVDSSMNIKIQIYPVFGGTSSVSSVLARTEAVPPMRRQRLPPSKRRNVSARNIAVLVALGASVTLLLPAAHAQTNHYVSLTGGNNTAPYTNWAMAATTIQAAIDASAPGAVIWVSNGIYQTGGTTNYPAGNTLTNRVAIHRPVTVRSVNGPSNTVIRGAWHPGTTNGPAAVRCVYMTNGAALIGFTVTNGATTDVGTEGAVWRMGGGIYASGSVVSNCIITWNACKDYGGGIIGGTLYNCDIYYNVNHYHGGGGARSATLYNCRVFHNTALGGLGYGGGIYGCNAYDCLIVSNYTRSGGGVRSSTLYNCQILFNTATAAGGASENSHFFNCLIAGNTAPNGGGVSTYVSAYTNYNCTIVGNTASGSGGGVYASAGLFKFFNCVVYNNMAGSFSNYTTSFTDFEYSDASPLPAGTGNIDANPIFVNAGSGYGANLVLGNYRLAIGSPCVNAGTNFPWQETDPLGYGRDKDLDGEPRLRGTVDMGAYEQYIAPGTIFILRGQ